MTTAPAPNHFSDGPLLSGRSDLIVRAMRPDDVETLALLEEQVEESPWSAGNFLDSLNTGHLCLVVQSASASFEASLAAWAAASLVLDESELLIIGTAPSMQRQGIGRALLTQLEAELARRGASSLYLEVRESNIPARHLYELWSPDIYIPLFEQNGFVVVGRRRGYYRHLNGREDALLMRRELPEASKAPAALIDEEAL